MCLEIFKEQLFFFVLLIFIFSKVFICQLWPEVVFSNQFHLKIPNQLFNRIKVNNFVTIHVN